MNVSGNQLTDLSPLVANASLAAGTWVEVHHNCIDLTPGSAAMDDIDALLDRGVSEADEPQHEGC